ncbi:MAG: hypothetical protein E6Q97_38955 [Desulfurellales bacterium]|nr:MAG: hypothetical protein E6Q97_38955 [Desulfurellales bacterium]
MEIVDNRAVLIRTRNPQKYSIIPKSKVVADDGTGGYTVAVYWGLDEMRVLRNLGVKRAPSPIRKNYNWPGRYTPMSHQIDTAEFMTMHRRCFCFNEAGTGKSMAALWAADYLMRRGEIRRVLVICPMSTMQSVWIGDINNSVMHRSAVVAHHPQAMRRVELVQGNYEFVILNYDGLELVADAVRNDGRFDLIIVDESTAYSNAQTDRWKALSSIITPTTFVWMMTGTPAAQSPVQAYGMAKIVNPNGVPRFQTAWRDKVMNKVTKFKWAPKDDAKEQVNAALQPAIRFTKAQCMDLPPVLTETRLVPMTAQQLKYYKLIKEQMLAQAAGTTITAVNAGVVVNKLLQISCIAYNTPVLTDSGWVPIQSVTLSQRVWDGVEFVAHAGLLHQGRREVVSCFGVHMTPEHEVLTTAGWLPAKECLDEQSSTGLERATVRLPDGVAASRNIHWTDAESALVVPLRLWNGGGSREPVSKNEASACATALRLSARQQNTRHVGYAAVPRMARHTSKVHQPFRQRLAQLWSAGHNGLRSLGAVFRGVLERHVFILSARAYAGANRQQCGVLTRELPVGDYSRTGKQQTHERYVGYASWAHDDETSGRGLWHTLRGSLSALKDSRLGRGTCADHTGGTEVYDIAHCGPRARFTVLGADGMPLIVHNCGAALSDGKEVVLFDAGPRLKVLTEVVREASHKVLIFALYRASIDVIVEHLERQGIKTAQIHGGVGQMKRGQIINDFQTTDAVQALVMQPYATAHGITLTAADTVVFYGPLTSVEMYLQCIARSDRKGQTAEKVTVIHIQSSPVEERLFKAMGSKVTEQALLVGMFEAELKN